MRNIFNININIFKKKVTFKNNSVISNFTLKLHDEKSIQVFRIVFELRSMIKYYVK